MSVISYQNNDLYLIQHLDMEKFDYISLTNHTSYTNLPSGGSYYLYNNNYYMSQYTTLYKYELDDAHTLLNTKIVINFPGLTPIAHIYYIDSNMIYLYVSTGSKYQKYTCDHSFNNITDTGKSFTYFPDPTQFSLVVW